MFITALLPFLIVRHIDPHIIDWIIQFQCDALAYRAIRNTFYFMWKKYEELFQELTKGRRLF